MAPASKEPENPSLSTAGQEALNEQECSGAMTAGETTLSVGTKRRRVEHAQSTLTRPFKSPLKTSSLHATSSVKDDSQLSQNQKRGRYDGQGVEGSGNTNDPPIEKGNRRMKPNQNPIAITPDKKRVSSPGFVTHSISSSPLLAPSLARRVAGVHRGTSSNTSTSSQQSLSPMRRLLSPMKQPPYLATNPRLVTLQRQHSNILRSLSSARNTLNLLQQATRIEKQKQDEQLKDLTNHWRQVAQRAAEEVFTGAKERIDRMGGVKAWREMSTGKNNPA
ncbi:hypothetical protein KEM54_000978 [Ascosphaera aggregata]|nr:hypothetical protein KEM54_000978 [Ascosphaera aggregata]